MMKNFLALLSFISVFAFGQQQDFIQLKNGEKIIGEVRNHSHTRVRIKLKDDKTKRYSIDEVSFFEMDSSLYYPIDKRMYSRKKRKNIFMKLESKGKIMLYSYIDQSSSVTPSAGAGFVSHFNTYTVLQYKKGGVWYKNAGGRKMMKKLFKDNQTVVKLLEDKKLGRADFIDAVRIYNGEITYEELLKEKEYKQELMKRKEFKSNIDKQDKRDEKGEYIPYTQRNKKKN
jgi:hypothetical protein